MIECSQVTGLLLAGGQGRRVGGKDKGLLPFNHSTLAESQLNWLKAQTSQCLISANRNLSFYSQLGCSVLIDHQSNFPGPLAGILKGLEQCSTEWLFVLPVDVPYLPNDLLRNILQALNNLPTEAREKSLGFYLETNKRAHYLNLLLSKKAMPALVQFLASDDRRVRSFLKRVNAQSVDLGIGESAFRNLNNLADYNLDESSDK